jgi:hypothetical protein
VVDKITIDSSKEDGNSNLESRVENAGAEASDGGNPLHGASASAPPTPGTEPAAGAPEGTPAASSAQETTPPKTPDDKLQTITEKDSDKEEENSTDESS